VAIKAGRGIARRARHSLGYGDRDQASHDHSDYNKPKLRPAQQSVSEPAADSAQRQPGGKRGLRDGVAVQERRAPTKGSRPSGAG
jgi:hypothetical protein